VAIQLQLTNTSHIIIHFFESTVVIYKEHLRH